MREYAACVRVRRALFVTASIDGTRTYTVYVLGPTHLRRHVRARSVGVDRVWLGAQAFYGAKAFNANIGAWNTAAVTTLSVVCAALSPRRRATARAGRARRGTSMRRGPLCAAVPPMRARV